MKTIIGIKCLGIKVLIWISSFMDNGKLTCESSNVIYKYEILKK